MNNTKSNPSPLINNSIKGEYLNPVIIDIDFQNETIEKAMSSIVDSERGLVEELLMKKNKTSPLPSLSNKSWFYVVSFFLPSNTKNDFYFSSLSAIYCLFSEKQIGCKVSNLWSFGVRPGHPFKNRECSITKVPLYRKKRKG